MNQLELCQLLGMYIGCKAICKNPYENRSSEEIVKGVMYDYMGDKQTTFSLENSDAISDCVKLLLKPLNKMSFEERQEVAPYIMGNNVSGLALHWFFDEVENVGLRLTMKDKYRRDEIQPIFVPSAAICKLIRMGFDSHGLIEKGLATDITLQEKVAVDE